MPRNYDEDDDRPRKRRRPADDEDEDRPRARRRVQDEDDYDDRPRRKKKKKKLKPRTNVAGVIALVIGIGAVLFSFIPCLGLYAVIPGALGVIVGVIGLLISHQSEGRYERRLPVIGLSVSAVAILFGLSWIFIANHWKKEFDKGLKEAEAQTAKEEAARKKELASAAGEVQAAGADGAVRVTPFQFAKDYDDDEDTADFKYKNRVLEITGTVHEVSFLGETYTVLLRAGGEDDTVDCEFAKNPDVRARLAQLKPGDTVTIRGKCLGGGATIEACVLVQ